MRFSTWVGIIEEMDRNGENISDDGDARVCVHSHACVHCYSFSVSAMV